VLEKTPEIRRQESPPTVDLSKLTASAAKVAFLQTAKLLGFFPARFFSGFSKERTYTHHLFFLQQLTMRPKSLQAFFCGFKG
jgi:hypothetical protein